MTALIRACTKNGLGEYLHTLESGITMAERI